MSESKTTKERLATIEAHLEYIKDNMVSKSTIGIMKWALGGVGTLALSAILIAAKVKGG